MTGLALFCAAIGLVPVALGLVNLAFYRRLPKTGRGARPAVSVLIPARNEEARIEAALEAVRASRDIDFEVVVLDDSSEDRTAAIVAALAARDGRVRLERAPALPSGWSGKQHACHVLAGHARHDLMVFVDADVRLAPDALARIANHVGRTRLPLISGFPRQETETLGERLIIPVIHFLLLGYLPLFFARWFRSPMFGAGCGQLMIVRRDAYDRAGGHAAIRDSMHDGIKLPRAFRKAGIMTGLFDATDVATCRMYEGFAETWSGFAKNATEGMATPVALPIWTVLLFGGQIAPLGFLVGGLLAGLAPTALMSFALAFAGTIGLRLVYARRFRQSLLGAILHPVGVALVLAIQWAAFVGARLGRGRRWRGRRYESA